MRRAKKNEDRESVRDVLPQAAINSYRPQGGILLVKYMFGVHSSNSSPSFGYSRRILFLFSQYFLLLLPSLVRLFIHFSVHSKVFYLFGSFPIFFIFKRLVILVPQDETIFLLSF